MTDRSVAHIPTRLALIKRAEKIVKDIDQYFDDAEAFGLAPKESDPDGLMLKIRKGLIEMLEREGRIKNGKFV